MVEHECAGPGTVLGVRRSRRDVAFGGPKVWFIFQNRTGRAVEDPRPRSPSPYPVILRDNTACAPCTPSLRARQHHVRAMHAQSSYATTPHARRARPVFLRDDTACAPRTPGLPARQHRVRAMHAHSSCGTTPRACHARPVFLRDNTVCAPCTAMRGQSAVGKNPPASRS